MREENVRNIVLPTFFRNLFRAFPCVDIIQRFSSCTMSRAKWQRDFIHAKSLNSSSSSSSVLPQRRGDSSEEWVSKQLRKLGKSRSCGRFSPNEQEEVYRRLAEAGRDLDRGYISQSTYERYVSALLHKSNAVDHQKEGSSTLSATVPSCAAHHRTTVRNEENAPDPGASWQARVKARSLRERQRTLAWVERVAKRVPLRSRDCDEDNDDAKYRVLVTQVPVLVPIAAIRKVTSKFGRVSRVEKLECDELDGSCTYVANFEHSTSARAAVDAGMASIGCVVQVSPIPKDCDEQCLRRILAKFGRVVSARLLNASGETTSTFRNDATAASVVFEVEASAAAAVGDRRIEAANELQVTAVPDDATEDQVKRCYGGRANGVISVEFDRPKQCAIVAFESSKLCARAVGARELVVTRQGGFADAIEKSQRAARKGAPPPWHTSCAHRPFADYNLHNFRFGHSPSSTTEFNQRAAGTFSYQGSKGQTKLGATSKYTSRRCAIHGTLRATTLHVRQVNARLHFDYAP